MKEVFPDGVRHQSPDRGPRCGQAAAAKKPQRTRPKRGRLFGLLEQRDVPTGHWIGRKQTSLWCRDGCYEHDALTRV